MRIIYIDAYTFLYNKFSLKSNILRYEPVLLKMYLHWLFSAWPFSALLPAYFIHTHEHLSLSQFLLLSLGTLKGTSQCMIWSDPIPFYLSIDLLRVSSSSLTACVLRRLRGGKTSQREIEWHRDDRVDVCFRITDITGSDDAGFWQ